MSSRSSTTMTKSSTDIRTYLEESRARVDAALEALMPPADSAPTRIHEAMRYSVFSGGKRLRPILALEAFAVSGGTGDAAVAPACATELIHTYSLIHDDLPAMDDDDLRRGKPTCHRVFGEAVAILAGDGLLTLAFEVAAGADSVDWMRRVEIIRELASANGSRGMVGGQAADIESEGREPTLEALEFIHENKTGKALVAALRVGAFAASADVAALDALTSYGRKIGLAFQVSDDLLDVRGTAEEMGKAVGKDAGKGKLTYPGLVGVEKAAARARELSEGAVADLELFGGTADRLRSLASFIVERRN